MKKIFVSLCLLLGACTTSQAYVGESPYTVSNWRLAIENRNADRYELAYHYYSLALSSARTEAGILKIQKRNGSIRTCYTSNTLKG